MHEQTIQQTPSDANDVEYEVTKSLPLTARVITYVTCILSGR